MKISSLLETLALFLGSQFVLSALGIYNPSIWFLTGWIVYHVDLTMKRGNLRW